MPSLGGSLSHNPLHETPRQSRGKHMLTSPLFGTLSSELFVTLQQSRWPSVGSDLAIAAGPKTNGSLCSFVQTMLCDSQQFPAVCFPLEKSLVFISHFAMPSHVML